MIILRSLLFNLAFYLNLCFWLIVALPTLLLPRWGILFIAKSWGWTSLWLLRLICGTKVVYRGLEKIPQGGLLVAGKHQSIWETFVLVTLFTDSAYVLKRELMWLPFFGWYLWKADQIPVDRGKGSLALMAMYQKAREAIGQGRQILIFPEGTRRAPGAEPAYKFGLSYMYENFGATCVPVALNSGLYWPRRSFIRRPGTIILEVLDPIPPGMAREAFHREVQNRIEAASDRLLQEGLKELASLRDS